MPIGVACANSTSTQRNLSLAEILNGQGSLTFFKDFRNGGTVDADYSVGSPTGTFTRTACNCTYTDSNGVLQLVTAANTPRYQGGYYDTTGFHAQSGLMIESTESNKLFTTYGNADANADGVADNWAVSNSTAEAPTTSLVANTSLINITDSKAQRIVYIDGADTNKAIILQQDTAAASYAATNAITASCYVKGSSTGTTIALYLSSLSDVPAVIDTANSGAITLSTSWQRVHATIASAGVGTDRARFTLRVDGIDQGDTVDLYVTGMQVEANGHPTSYIPTTTAAVTRNKDILYFARAGNSSLDDGTIFVKFAPYLSYGEQDTYVTVVSIYPAINDFIAIRYDNTGGGVDFQVSGNGGASNIATNDAGMNLVENTSYVVSGDYGDPADGSGNTLNIYKNGVSEGVSTSAYVSPNNEAGVNMAFGHNGAGNGQVNMCLQAAVVFSNRKSVSEHLAIVNILNS